MASTSTSAAVKATPLPKKRLAVLAAININEGFQMNVIWPFIPFYVQDFFSEDNPSLGMYVGLIASSFLFGQFLTARLWARLADRFGRRPVFLWGVLASAAMILLFGWGFPYWITLGFRLLGGILNGNIGITRVYLGEITDRTNQAAGFSLLVITFSVGSTIGPIVGGYLSKPGEKFSMMDTPFWHDHPYLLPCIVSAAWGVFGSILGFFLLPESETWQRTRAMKLFEQMAANKAGTSTVSSKSSHPEIPRDAYQRLPTSSTTTDDNGNGRVHHNGLIHDSHSDATSYSKLTHDDNNTAASSDGADGGGGDAASPKREVGYLAFSSARQEIPIYTTTPANVVSLPDAKADTTAAATAADERTALRSSYDTFTSSSDDNKQNRSKHIEDVNFDKPAAGTYSKTTSVAITSEATAGSPSSSPSPLTAEALSAARAHREAILAERDAQSCQCPCGCMSRRCDYFVTRCLLRLLPPDAKHRNVLYACLLLSTIGLAGVMQEELLPLFCQESVEKGGLGFSSDQIGTLLSIQGVAFFVYQFGIFRRIMSWLGPVRAVRWSVGLLVPYFIFFPTIATIAEAVPSWTTWLLMGTMVSIRASLGATSFTACTLLVNNAAVPENKSSVNGFAQMLNSGIRSAAPLLGGTLWSWSVEIDVFFNAYIVYFIIVTVFTIALTIALQVPFTLNTPPDIPPLHTASSNTTVTITPAASSKSPETSSSMSADH